MESVKANLKKKWNIEPYNFWIPLSGKVEENTIYFETEDFEKEFGYEKLNRILLNINNGKIYSCNEAEEENVYDEILIKEYDSPDVFFTDENANWVIYQTHEETITFAGKELIEKIIQSWDEYRKFMNPWETN